MSKKIIKKLIWAVVVLLISMNLVAFFHAYKFTHFDASRQIKTIDPKELSFGKKIETLIFGVSNPRPKNHSYPAKTFETINLHSNKRIEAWLIKAHPSKGIVLLFHGYGAKKSGMLDKADIFHELGYSTMLVDFMGSGGSEGNQTTIGYKEAEEVKTCVDFLSKNGEEKIILFGTSLGATAIMKAVNDYQLPVTSIIIECPFGTMLQTVQNRFKTMGVPSFPMANLLVFWGGVENGFNAFKHNPVDYAKKINCPTLLIYGEKDEKVTPQETSTIFSNLRGRKSLLKLPLAGHENYLIKYKDKWTLEVSQFLENGKED